MNLGHFLPIVSTKFQKKSYNILHIIMCLFNGERRILYSKGGDYYYIIIIIIN